ncbi:MAG: JDVT-CTERM system glutamic-type intramembrane protease [Thermodesulfobacteriota bacterium]
MPTRESPFLLRCLRSELGRLLSGLADPAFLGLACLGLTAWLLPRPAAALSPGILLLKAGIEEAVFRAGLQEALARFLPARLGPLTLANLLASAAFALVHLASHPPLWAGLVFLPSLCFGLAWDRHRSLLLCALLHFLYNFLLFYRP